MLDALTFRPLAEASLPAAASNDLWVVADQLYVETARNELHCFNAGSSLELNWTVPLEASPLAGPPLLEGEILVVAMQDGEILAIDVATGKVSNRLDLGQPLNLGPRRVGKVLVVPSIDGSLHRIEAVLQTGEQ
jgi:outer membrane protein assembly factor BamB